MNVQIDPEYCKPSLMAKVTKICGSENAFNYTCTC